MILENIGYLTIIKLYDNLSEVKLMKIFNCHTHTGFSHDGKGSIDEICESAVNNGLIGFAVTDHLDCEYSDDEAMIRNIASSFEASEKAKNAYKGKLIISSGVEIGEAIYAPTFAKSIISSFDWDVILGSVHAVRKKNYDMPFSVIDFSLWNEEMINEYISQYFKDMLETVRSCDFDVLTHLTVVLRYIKYKYSKPADITSFYPIITEILRHIIASDKTLEVNSSGLADGYLMPDIEILRLYKTLGGRRLTVGSDSHIPFDIANRLRDTVNILKAEGFEKLTYYIKRTPVEYEI